MSSTSLSSEIIAALVSVLAPLAVTFLAKIGVKADIKVAETAPVSTAAHAAPPSPESPDGAVL